MREATIVAALPLTAGIGMLGIVYCLLTWNRPNRFELLALFVLSVTSAVPVYWMRRKIVRSRWREPFFLSWTLVDFAMIIAGTLADGGTGSPLVVVFFLPVIFSSMSYPLGSVLVVGLVAVASYLGVAIASGGSSLAYEVGFSFMLLSTAAISAWQAHNHNRQHTALGAVSRTDSLTSSLNRRGFVERAEAQLDAMRAASSRGAILTLDIDHFKSVNDRFGHAAGDELLCWVSETLQRLVRSTDCVGRLGGDEFAVMFAGIDPVQARLLATRIDETLSARAPSSLGLAVFPDDGETLDELSRKADVRLYASRQARRRGVQERQAAYAAGATGGELWRSALDTVAGPARGAPAQRSELERVLLDQLDASVMVLDLTGRVISWNSGAEALYGWTREEAIGANSRDLVVPEDTAPAEKLSTELQRDGRWDGEMVVRRKDGSTFTAYLRNRLVVDEDGAPACIVGVAVDISERVAAETELLQSRDYARAVTECMGEGLFTLDTEGRLTYINQTGQQILGRSADELLGRCVTEAVWAPDGPGEQHSFAGSPFGHALIAEDTIRVADDHFLSASSEPVAVAYTATPVRTPAGVQGCVVIFGDISEMKRREAETRRDAEVLATIKRVESALVEERLVLHAQPIIDLRSGEVVQHELLVRMVEPDGALVPPKDFLPVAEQYSLITEIDWWVIKQATRIAGEGCPVQLNISARSLGDRDVLEHIERCIRQNRVPPGAVVFEITETAIMEDERAARKFAEGLRELGCAVALDDFGTGWGSLTYLKQIPVDFLKLDIEFIRDLATSSASLHVVEAVKNLARDFHLKTIAEGVEDPATLALLAGLEVDLAQGFHIARPQPFERHPGDRVNVQRLRSRATEAVASRRPAAARRA